jgi:putative methyltransferase (TIGR04325 family)
MSLAATRDLIPPIVINTYRDLRGSRREYRSFAEAERLVESGYASAELARLVVKKTEIFRASSSAENTTISSGEFALFSALLSLQEFRPISILDFGGGAGATYYRARRWASAPSIEWRVVETDVMVAAAGPTAPEELSFYPDLSSAIADMPTAPDLVLVSSALQYLDRPEAVLAELVDLGSRRFVVSRTPLATSTRVHTLIQKSRLSENGPGPLPPGTQDTSVRYPVSFVPVSTVSGLLRAHYQHVHHVVEEPRMRKLRRGVIVGQHSFLASRPYDR